MASECARCEFLPFKVFIYPFLHSISHFLLRPEFVESTYFLYLATKSPFYQHIGMQIIDSLNLHTRVSCGFATVHNVLDKSLEDRMESFFLSETCKYLYLVRICTDLNFNEIFKLFDTENPVNRHYEKLLFSTEGHTFPISRRLRRTPVGPALEGSGAEMTDTFSGWTRQSGEL